MSVVLEPKLTLSRQEIEDLLTNFSPADWKRAKVIAATFSGGLTGWSPEDLLQEALTKLMEGKRVWHANLHPLVVLKSVMHSISSNIRNRIETGPIDEGIVLDPTAELEYDVTPTAHGIVSTTPEDIASGKQQLAEIYAALAGDEEIELLAMAWSDGIRGQDAIVELDWEKKKHDAARKRLLRRLEALNLDRRTK